VVNYSASRVLPVKSAEGGEEKGGGRGLLLPSSFLLRCREEEPRRKERENRGGVLSAGLLFSSICPPALSEHLKGKRRGGKKICVFLLPLITSFEE